MKFSVTASYFIYKGCIIITKLESKVGNALKWSIFAELVAKLILPISNMILARLLTPEMFGIVATITMVTSFADIFTDAGFQKYIVQYEFDTEDEKNLSTNVAFWTNLFLSVLIWSLIIIFRHSIADLVGNKGLGNVIALCSVTIPMTAFSSLQSALFRRELNFKKLFQVRIIGALIPIVLTVPLAVVMKDYRAILIGTIVRSFVDAVILSLGSKWKPKFQYSFVSLKKMFSFSMWMLVEAIAIWMTSYIGTFIVGYFFSQYYVGLYKTAMTTVNQLISLLVAPTTTVLFSTLSRVQNDDNLFNISFFKFQRMTSILIVPMGIGILLYRNLITDIMLGNQWRVVSGFIGMWGAASAISVLWANYSCVAYVAKGKPKLSLFAQVIQILILLPTLYISSSYGFRVLCIARTMVRVAFVFINIVFCGLFTDISPLKMITNITPQLLSSAVMSVSALLLQQLSPNVIWQFCSIFICAIVYFLVLLAFPKMRQEVFEIDSVKAFILKLRTKRLNRKRGK